MKNLFIFLFPLLSYCNAFGQKPVIDTPLYGKWPGISSMQLSNNGKYMLYYIHNQPVKGHTTIVVGTTTGKWKKEFPDLRYPFCFSEDSRQFIYKTGKDSICLLTMETGETKYITHVKDWLLSQMGSRTIALWLVYQLDIPKNRIVVYNTRTSQQQSFNHVIGCQLISGGSAILLQQETSDNQVSLQWAGLSKDRTKTIWQGVSPGDMVFNKDSTKLIFIGRDSSKRKKQLWLYNKGEAKAVPLEIDSLDVDHLSNFSFDHTGNKLFFTVTDTVSKPGLNPALASVDIYSYKDAKLQSEQLLEHPYNSFTCLYNLSTRQIIHLNGANEEIKSALDGDWVLIEKDYGGNAEEWSWNKKSLRSIYVVSTINGSRKKIAENVPEPVCRSYQLSPSGKYVIHYDPKVKDYLSYDIVTGKVKDMTPGTKINWVDDHTADWPIPYDWMAGVLGWTPNDQAVLIKGHYDIFRADPEGKIPVINLTNSYGANHHITFDSQYPDVNSPYAKVIDPHAPVLMHFTNEDNNDEGFCRISLTRQKNPYFLSAFKKHFYDKDIVKARDTDLYALPMQNEQSAPNYYLTCDFKMFTQITDVQPQKAYNWLTAEMIHFKTPDGKTTQAILFKPENFDRKKKYPVIFEYYERHIVGGLHSFFFPGYSDGARINIPTYVSNGYLVCCPDIYYKVGQPGKSALNTIVSAAGYLSKFPWVDSHKMGLMGHSFGGFETSYIISHSHLFAAAVAMSPITDMLSAYGSLVLGSGFSRQHMFELYRDRIGATLWQRPDLYIENAPVLQADKVTTPVLLMANKRDEDVTYAQGFKFFTALRRLGKKAWMLQYDNGGHQVNSETDTKDITIRTRQFFDCYLMGKTPPKWMTEGIPASQKQLDNGYEQDRTGKTP